MHNLCNCPNCQTNNCPAAAELEALQSKCAELQAVVNHLHENRQLKIEAYQERDSLRTQNRELHAALRLLYDETADYIRVNHLGDVHHNQSMQKARDTLARIKEVEG